MPTLERLYRDSLSNKQKFSIIDELDKNNIEYDLIDAVKNPNHNYVRAVLLQDSLGYLLCIFMSNNLLAFKNLRTLLKRPELIMVSPTVSTLIDFYDNNLHTYPPLTKMLQVPAVIDKTCLQQIVSKNDNKISIPIIHENQKLQFLTISFDDFKKLQHEVIYEDIAVELNAVNNNMDYTIVIENLKNKVATTIELPILQPVATQLLKMRAKEELNVEELVGVVNKDPSLTLQLLTWARSPFYGYAGEINSLEDAIINVLGFDLVLNISLGLAVIHINEMPAAGPLSLKSFWQQAVYQATLNEKIVHKCNIKHKSKRGMAYLCGLLHNIGTLLMAHLFTNEFNKINEYYVACPNLDLNAIQNYVLHVNNFELGYWILSAWNMPAELQVTVKEYLNPDYTGEHEFFLCCNRASSKIMAMLGLGVERNLEITDKCLATLELTKEDLQTIAMEFDDAKEELNAMIEILCKQKN